MSHRSGGGTQGPGTAKVVSGFPLVCSDRCVNVPDEPASDGPASDGPPPDESAPEAQRSLEVEAFLEELALESRLRLAEMGGELLLENTPRFMTPYENQASSAECVNRWVHKASVSLRQTSQVLDIRKDQARDARERRERIFAEHEWVEVPNAHPSSDTGLANELADADFDPTSSNELLPEHR